MSAAFFIKIEQTKAFLFQGQLGMAQGLLNDLEAESTVQSRWKDHYLGIIKMRQGAFDQAISLFLNTLSKNGNYISVILDLASCYYMTGQMYNWQRMIELADYEYKNNYQKLELGRRIQVGLLLTKYLEEKGLVVESLESYQQLLNLVPSDDIKNQSNPEYIRISAQILRLHGQYGIKNSVTEVYERLVMHSGRNSHMDCDFEIQHALMIYELEFIGPDTALVRYQRLMNNPLADSAEQHWVQNDLFYGLLARGHTARAMDLRAQISGELNILSKTVLKIIKENSLSHEDYMECLTQVTPAAHLRLLKIWTMHSQDTMPLKRQKLLTDLFSKKTKSIWSGYFQTPKGQIPTKLVTIKVDSQMSRIEINPGGQHLYISQSLLEIFELFKNSDRLALSDVCQKLWSSEGSESDIARLRMRVSRLNDFLQVQIGLKGCFKLDKTHLKSFYQIT